MAETRKLLQQERWALLPEDILYRRVNSLTSPMWTSTLPPWSQHRLSTELHQTCLSVTFLQLSAWHPQFPFMGLKDPLLNAFFLILVHKSNRDKPDDKTDRLYTVAKLISQAKSPMLPVAFFKSFMGSSSQKQVEKCSKMALWLLQIDPVPSSWLQTDCSPLSRIQSLAVCEACPWLLVLCQGDGDSSASRRVRKLLFAAGNDSWDRLAPVKTV